jgi:uncharacterized protein
MKSLDSPKREPGSRSSRYVYLALTGLAALSCLGLDYLAARRGERAYVFPARRVQEAARPAPVPLADLVGRLFTQSGLPERDILRERDEEGQPRYSIELTKEAYLQLASPLRSLFQDSGADARVEEREGEGRTTYSWYVQRGDKEKLTLLFSCLPPPRPAGVEIPPRALPAPPARPAHEKIAAIIIDDMGNSLETLQEVFDLGIPLTISVLPQSPYAMETAQAAHDHEFEVMLHLPGESLNHQEDEAPMFPVVRSDMGPDEIRALVVDSLSRVPYASGVNNHMGSKITQDKTAMIPVLDVLRERRLFFIDSLTGNGSVAYNLARSMGLRTTYRNVFLDSEVGVDYSRRRLIELFELAKKKGRAVAIGHPFPETLQALRDCQALSRKYGVRLVMASQVIPD